MIIRKEFSQLFNFLIFEFVRLLRFCPLAVPLYSFGAKTWHLAIFLDVCRYFVISSVEHPSVTECALALKNDGFEVVLCNPLTNDFENEIDDKTVLVSCMLVNNETGLVLPVENLKKIILSNTIIKSLMKGLLIIIYEKNNRKRTRRKVY